MEQSVKQPAELVASPVEQETRRQILTKAADLFLAKGYRGVSMKELAEAVRVTPAALYYHFPKGKEELFSTMIQTIFVDDGVRDLERRMKTARDLRSRLTVLTTSLHALPVDERFSPLVRDARQQISDPEN